MNIPTGGDWADPNALEEDGPPPFTFDHGAASVPDIEAAIDWYRVVLGFEVTRRFDLPHGIARGAMLQRGDMRMELFEPHDPAPLPSARRYPDQDVRLLGNKHVAFRVHDLEGWADWLVRNEADIAHKVTGPFGAALFVRDCAGNLIEFLSRPQQGY